MNKKRFYYLSMIVIVLCILISLMFAISSIKSLIMSGNRETTETNSTIPQGDKDNGEKTSAPVPVGVQPFQTYTFKISNADKLKSQFPKDTSLYDMVYENLDAELTDKYLRNLDLTIDEKSIIVKDGKLYISIADNSTKKNLCSIEMTLDESFYTVINDSQGKTQ